MKWILVCLIGSTALANPQNCDDLGHEMRQKLSIPFKTFSDASTKSCVLSSNVNSKNLPLFIASTFYYKDLDLRKKALAKMETYSCEDKISCGDLYNLLDSHIKATTLVQPKSWKEFATRTSLLREKAEAKLNEQKSDTDANSKTIEQILKTLSTVTIEDLDHGEIFQLTADGKSTGPGISKGTWKIFKDKLVIQNIDARTRTYSIEIKDGALWIDGTGEAKTKNDDNLENGHRWIVNTPD